MEVITKDTEEVRAYFEALEEGMRYIDTAVSYTHLTLPTTPYV